MLLPLLLGLVGGSTPRRGLRTQSVLSPSLQLRAPPDSYRSFLYERTHSMRHVCHGLQEHLVPYEYVGHDVVGCPQLIDSATTYLSYGDHAHSSCLSSLALW